MSPTQPTLVGSPARSPNAWRRWPRITAVLVAAITGSAHAGDISQCGTVVPEREVGVLQVDLDCGVLPRGVTLQRWARLELNGHRLQGGQTAVFAELRKGSVAINGPGEIAGAGTGVLGFTSGGVLSGSQAKVKVRLTDVELYDSGSGASADVLQLKRVQAERNIHALYANYRITGSDVVTSNNDRFGVWTAAGSMRLKRLTATNNGWFGVIATQGGRVILSDSTVTGNAAGFGDIDVSSFRMPHLRQVACGKSTQSASVFLTSPSWSVCAND